LGSRRLSAERPLRKVVRATDEELAVHNARLAALDEASGGNCVWLKQGR
jgi:DNA polymerase-3 subunit epsilon